MKIVIDIPEETYKGIMLGKWYKNGLAYYVQVGTPLPKGHGDLVDYNDLSRLVGEDFRFFLSRLDLNLSQPIIKADKEVDK